MVAVRMRQENCIKMMDALPNKERHNDLLADRFRGRNAVTRLVAFEATAGVDHERMPARRLHEDRVPLADIDEGDS